MPLPAVQAWNLQNEVQLGDSELEDQRAICCCCFATPYGGFAKADRLLYEKQRHNEVQLADS